MGSALGTVDVELSVQTYSNDPNRYIPIMYGMKDPMVAGATIYLQKLPAYERIPYKVLRQNRDTPPPNS